MTSNIIRAFVLGTVFTMLTGIVHAGEIELRSTDGAFALTGELVEFDGEAYILKSVFGQVRIEANAVVCIGEYCPDLTAYTNKITVSASLAAAKNLFPVLLKEFADISGYQSRITDGSDIDLVDDAGDIVAQIIIDNSETKSGFADIAESAAMFAVTSLHPNTPEIAAINDAGFGDITSANQQTVLGMGALVILVSNDNPVNSLSMLQVGDIFSGKITNWNEVGGQDASINVYRQNVATGDSDFFAELLLSQSGGAITPTASIISSNGDISTSVNSDAHGIGFSGYANRGDAKPVTLTGSCGIWSAPTDFSIKTEEYPLSRRLMLFTPERSMPIVAVELVEYLKSDFVQQAIKNAGYVNLDVTEVSIDDQGLRFASAILSATDGIGVNNLQMMMRQLIGAKRLSSTFRFVEGSSTLDVRAQRDVQRLVDLLIGSKSTNKEVLLVGFTDSNGKLSVNMALAEQRAKQVLNALNAAAPNSAFEGLKFKAVGLGEVSPMACSDAPNERFLNRRVEIWIRNEQ